MQDRPISQLSHRSSQQGSKEEGTHQPIVIARNLQLNKLLEKPLDFSEL